MTTLARHIDALGGAINPVDDADRGAVSKFHTMQIRRILIGDKTMGENRDTIERAFADHRALGYSEALTDVVALINRLGFADLVSDKKP